MKTKILLFLFALGTAAVHAQCNETSKTKILLVGDSWAFFMNFDGTINKVAKDWGHSDVKYYTNLILSENGAETDDFLEPGKVSELAGKLASMTDLEAVHLSIGGNDFLGSWNVNYSQSKTDSLANAVIGRLDSIVALIHQVRPDIHIFWSGYVYTNFGEVIGSIPSFLQSAHPFYGRWNAMGFPTFDQINGMQNWFQEKVRQHYASNIRFTYIPASGLMQYVFGQSSNLQVPPGGSYAPYSVPMPLGDPSYPSPKNSMRDYALTKDCFHLSESGYYAFISYHFQKFYQKYLMDDAYTIALFEKSGNVSNSGIISDELKIGRDGTDEYAGIIHLDNAHIDYYVPEKLSLFLKIEEATGTNFLSSGEFELEIVEGHFGSSYSLEVEDFSTVASASGTPCVFGNNSVGKWVRLELPVEFNDYVRVSQSQIRIRYTGQTDGIIRFSNTSDPDFQAVLNIKYGASTMGVDAVNTSQLDVYPNPATDILTIKTDQHIENFSVFSVSGQLMLSGTTPSKEIFIRDLPSGMYLLNVQSGDSVQKVKFIKR